MKTAAACIVLSAIHRSLYDARSVDSIVPTVMFRACERWSADSRGSFPQSTGARGLFQVQAMIQRLRWTLQVDASSHFTTRYTAITEWRTFEYSCRSRNRSPLAFRESWNVSASEFFSDRIDIARMQRLRGVPFWNEKLCSSWMYDVIVKLNDRHWKSSIRKGCLGQRWYTSYRCFVSMSLFIYPCA